MTIRKPADCVYLPSLEDCQVTPRGTSSNGDESNHIFSNYINLLLSTKNTPAPEINCLQKIVQACTCRADVALTTNYLANGLTTISEP